MKSCPICGTDANDDTLQCEECGYKYTNLGPSLGAGQARSTEGAQITNVALVDERPTGRLPIIVGWICFGIAVVLVFISFAQAPQSWERDLAANPYASADLVARVAQGYARQWLLRLVGGGFFSLFLIFWSVGYIVRAISFLPGKDQE